MKINKSHKIISGFLIFVVLLGFVFFFNWKNSSLPDVILITIDALRADHLSGYGYPRRTSPNIDRLAEKGTSFLNCFATSSTTITASPALLTGQYLTVSDSIRNSFYNSFTLNNLLDKRFTTLAGYLKKFGYFTAAFLNNVLYRGCKGFEQGFDYYCTSWQEGSAEEITTKVLNFLKDYRSNKPFFIWVHYLDAHAPYPPIAPHHPYSLPEEYLKVFEDDELYKVNDRILKLREKDNSIIYTRSEGYIPPIVFREGKYNLNYYIARYDAAIHYIDFHLGRLFSNLKDPTIIILTADHGESLGEHNVYFTHGEDVYDELLHVPLIIKDNGYFKGGKKISTVVSSIDIVPTLLSRVNPTWYFFCKNRFNGIDLKIITEGKDIKRKYMYSYFPGNSIRDVNKNIKYILDTNKEELYILPDEYTNHIKDNAPEMIRIKEELRRNLKKWFKNYPMRSDINAKKMSLDKDAEEILRNLGYLQ